jgi:hypothetical protein
VAGDVNSFRPIRTLKATALPSQGKYKEINSDLERVVLSERLLKRKQHVVCGRPLDRRHLGPRRAWVKVYGERKRNLLNDGVADT